MLAEASQCVLHTGFGFRTECHEKHSHNMHHTAHSCSITMTAVAGGGARHLAMKFGLCVCVSARTHVFVLITRKRLQILAEIKIDCTKMTVYRR